jgi:hypothetical protein
MALNSIARLAVHIFTDVSQMLPGFQRAQQETRSFAASTDHTSSKLLTFGKQLINSTGALGRFSGLATGIGAAGGPLGLVVAGSAAAAVAVGRFTLELGQAADAARDFQIVTERNFLKAFDDLHGTSFALGDSYVTTGEKLDALKEKYAEFAQLSSATTRPLITAANQLVEGFKQAGIGIGLINPSEAANVEAATQRVKRLAEETKELAKIEDDRRKAAEQEIATIQREMEASVSSMKSRGEQLEQSLRTPLEKLRESMEELDRLRSGGFIGDETLSRGLRQAADEYRKAITEAKSPAITPTAAAERGTAAGFSALVKGQLQIQVNPTVLRLEQQQLDAIRAVRAAVLSKDPIRFKVANLPP